MSIRGGGDWFLEIILYTPEELLFLGVETRGPEASTKWTPCSVDSKVKNVFFFHFRFFLKGSVCEKWKSVYAKSVASIMRKWLNCIMPKIVLNQSKISSEFKICKFFSRNTPFEKYFCFIFQEFKDSFDIWFESSPFLLIKTYLLPFTFSS